MSLNKARSVAEGLRETVQGDKDKQTPADAALEKAKETATTATESLRTITEENKKAVKAANIFSLNSPSLVAMQQSTLDKKQAAELAKGVSAKGYELNSQQRMGAYAATPPEFTTMVEVLRVIRDNTHGLRQPTYNPVGNRPTTFGTHQRR